MKFTVWSSAIALAAAAGVDPQYAVNLTVFHVNEASYTGVANMDTGDAAGDTFFALRSVYTPIECADNSSHHFGGDCDNPEVVGGNLTVTEVTLEVDSRFGGYSECNVCVNSTVPFTKNTPCTDGDYVCVCGSFAHLTTDCPPTVGREEPAEVFAKFKPRPGSPNYMWWLHNLVERIGGYWYSTPGSGECKDDGSVDPCYWRVVETKRQIDKKCQDDYVFHQITTADPDCFAGCPQPTNATSTCFIECFYATLLGDNSGKAEAEGGLDKDTIVDMWQFPVTNDETKGGCPDYRPY